MAGCGTGVKVDRRRCRARGSAAAFRPLPGYRILTCWRSHSPAPPRGNPGQESPRKDAGGSQAERLSGRWCGRADRPEVGPLPRRGNPSARHPRAAQWPRASCPGSGIPTGGTPVAHLSPPFGAGSRAATKRRGLRRRRAGESIAGMDSVAECLRIPTGGTAYVGQRDLFLLPPLPIPVWPRARRKAFLSLGRSSSSKAV